VRVLSSIFPPAHWATFLATKQTAFLPLQQGASIQQQGIVLQSNQELLLKLREITQYVYLCALEPPRARMRIPVSVPADLRAITFVIFSCEEPWARSALSVRVFRGIADWFCPELMQTEKA